MRNSVIEPSAIHRRFFHQQVASINLRRDFASVMIGEKEVVVDLASATLSSAPNWLFLRKITLATPQNSFDLAGISQDAVDEIETAIQKARRRGVAFEALSKQADQVLTTFTSWSALSAQDAYLTKSQMQQWRDHAPNLTFPEGEDADLVDRLSSEDQRRLFTVFAATRDTPKAIDRRNAAYVQYQLKAFKEFFDTVESNPLTEQQREAIVHDEDNALVIAGAGTGKTSTVVGKVGYILQKGWAAPDEILLLAFTKKAADEMQERIEKKLGVEIKVRTFHALGLEIVATAQGRKPSLCPEAEDPRIKAQTIKSLITNLLADDGFRQDLLAFQSSLRRAYKPAWEFKSQAQYTQYLLDVEPRALNGRLLKSYEECEIANWLTIKGIKFEYEHPYEIDTTTAEHRQYKPDFYLPEQGIYIEHLGISRNGIPAPFMNQNEYLDKMKWAREVHAANGTRLVETYSWERQDSVLLTNLAAKLQEHGVQYQPISMDTALALLNDKGGIDPFAALVGTFLSLFKSAGCGMKELNKRADQGGEIGRSKKRRSEKERSEIGRSEKFLRLFQKLFTAYEALIHAKGEIDFDDMITLAREHAADGTYRSNFHYILVDEFQDISEGRAKLILALRNQVEGAKMFCVGDDWQSIYRFTGSDISLTTEFERWFGFTRKTNLDLTFRFHDKIAGFSSRFVQKNPGQLRKELSTMVKSDQPGVVVHQGDGAENLPAILEQIAAQGAASVFILGRYKFSAPDNLKALQGRFPRLSIRFMTAHGSKGLEADYVIILGLSSGKYGFPSEIADDPVLGMVLADGEAFEHSEERRLFYVSLTRARKRAYLLADAASPSAFVREVLADDGYEKVVVEASPATSDVCPSCTRGKIVKREGDFGIFYSCSNHPICEYKEPSCSRCKRGRMRQDGGAEAACDVCGLKGRTCPQCRGGVLVVRHGKKSGRAFWGCSTFSQGSSSCDYTEWIRT